jgi:hypothetical protein
MSIEIINVASSTHSGDNDSNLAGVIKLIVYKENNVESVLQLSPPNMDNFVPIEQVTNDILVEWVELSKQN